MIYVLDQIFEIVCNCIILSNRVSEKSDENKMTASNLGIIFGPTLIKPRQADAEVSLSSLVDYPYQALIVELLIRHYEMIFDTPLSPLPPSSPVGESSPLPIKSRFTTQEKEQQLNRHSKSLVDIKEVNGQFVGIFLMVHGFFVLLTWSEWVIYGS